MAIHGYVAWFSKCNQSETQNKNIEYTYCQLLDIHTHISIYGLTKPPLHHVSHIISCAPCYLGLFYGLNTRGQGGGGYWPRGFRL